MSTSDLDHDAHKTAYDLPFVMPFLRRYKCFSYIPSPNDSEVYTGIQNLNAHDSIEQATSNSKL